MGLITKPADYTATTAMNETTFNALKNPVYDEVNGNLDNANIAAGAAISSSKIADTAVVAGNTVAPGTQTVTRPTVFTALAVGGGTGTATPVGVLHISTTAAGNVGAGTDDLISYSLPASTLNTTARGLRITARGKTANNANAKTLTLNLGSQVLITTSLSASIDGFWEIVAYVIRTGASTQYTHTLTIEANNGSATNTVMDGDQVNGTQTETAAIIIKCTGAATANDDIIQQFLLVEAL